MCSYHISQACSLQQWLFIEATCLFVEFKANITEITCSPFSFEGIS